MAEAVVSFVVERLGDFAIQEAKFLYGVGDQVKAADLELRLMKGFLRDADARQRNEETVRIWVSEIRDAAYDLEDVIEVYAFKVARRGGFKYVMTRFACVFKRGFDLHKIGAEIQSITTKLTTLRSSMQTYNIREIREIEDGTSSSMQRNLRRTYSHVIEGEVVGLEDDVNKVAMHLVKDVANSHRVISIWGMGGSGKTTLAKQVYHHREVRSKFDCSAWMCISQQCNVREVWVGILLKLLSPTKEQREEIGNMQDGEIAKKLYLLQQERRCLVILDDIWRVNTWESLKAAFPLNEKSKSKMLLTTRNKEVALHSDRNGILHQPRLLNEDESWKLLEKMAITGRGHIDPETYSNMKNLGKKMLQRCTGLPLAITVLGGLLARKDSINEWEMVLKNVLEFIRRGKGHETEYGGAMQVLELSYDDLPYHLKPCFLYLGNYPEDSEIKVKELTQLWIAEGFIPQPNQRQGSVETMEEVAYNWLNELVERCLVQVGRQGSIRKIKTCHLHDLVRDMCLLKAQEENFLQVISLREDGVNSSMETNTKVMGKVRRLAIHVDDNVDNLVSRDNYINGHHMSLRSLLYFGKSEWKLESKRLMQSMFKDFKFLRVLKFEGMKGEVELPNDIGKMVHLRYLSLMGSKVKKLPSSIAKLTCLQTLNLKRTNLEPIPNLVREMKQLRHLYISVFSVYWGSTIGKQQLSSLCNLQTLQIRNEDFEWNELVDLTSLRKLSLKLSRPLKNMEQLLNSTSSTLNCIQSLSVINELPDDNSAQAMQIVSGCPHIYKLELWYLTIELPQDPQYYPHLTKLVLVRCQLKDGQMAVLEKLPNLTKVQLEEVTFEENKKSLVCSKGGFPRLQVLCLYGMELDDWKVEEGAMPNLRELTIVYCEELRRLPEGLRYINTLQKIEINRMRKAFCSRLQEGGEDFYIVQHVPSVVFQNIRPDE